MWLTFLWGRDAAGRVGGVTAAVLVAATPVVLFQAVWPMSDVPAGASWTGAGWAARRGRRGAVVSAVFTLVGLVIRPNLLPLVGVPFTIVAASNRGRDRWIGLGLFTLILLPAPIAIAFLNKIWFGDPWVSGYGSLSELYQWTNVVPNIKLYAAWLWQAERAWPLLAIVPFMPVLSRAVRQRQLLAPAAMFLGIAACYLPYAQFEAWWYWRFLIPGLGALSVLMASGLVAIAKTVRSPWGPAAAAVMLCLALSGWIDFARQQNVFGGLQANEHRYAIVGAFAAAHLPRNAIVFASQHSGSIRFYGGRYTLRYNFVEPGSAGRVVPELVARGFHPYMVIDDWETPDVQDHFGLPRGAALPWPVAARLRELGGVTVFDLSSAFTDVQPVALEPSPTSRFPTNLEGPIAIPALPR